MPAVSGIKEALSGQVKVVTLDYDDRSLDPIRRRYNITGQAQYLLVDEADSVLWRHFGRIDPDRVIAEIEAILQA